MKYTSIRKINESSETLGGRWQWAPVVRQELLQLRELHRIDAREDVGEVLDRVNIVSCARMNKSEVDSHCSAAGRNVSMTLR